MKTLDMKLFHPRRWLRSFGLWYGAAVFRAQCRFYHVHCTIGQTTRIRHCRVRSKIDGILVIGDGCALRGVHFGFYGKEGRIELKDHIEMNAYPDSRVSLFVNDGSSIVIEDHCLFSNTVDISTTDWHRILDENGNRLNPDKDVHIGRRVWVGRKVTICKGVSVPDNSVIGVGSVVTKSFPETNVVIAGNPAEVKKRGIRW